MKRIHYPKPMLRYWNGWRGRGLIVMIFKELEEEATKAINMLEEYFKLNQDMKFITTIIIQMEFIQAYAKVHIDPLKAVLEQNKQFTFGILSSKNFASPKELAIKEQLNIVSELMEKVHSELSVEMSLVN